MTWAFLYLAIFLLGFTLALVSGLVRRVIHPSELCGWVIQPSHEHWASLRTPRSDLVISFLTVFGLLTFLVHGFTTMGPTVELSIGAVAGVVGAAVLRMWLCHAIDPSAVTSCEGAEAMVVRDIPDHGFGQVEVQIGSCAVKLAARSAGGEAIPTGSPVSVVDRQESVVVVRVTT